MNSRPYSWATAPPRPQTRIWFRNKVSWIQRILLPNSQVPGIIGIYSNCPNISFQVDFKITLLPAKITYYDFFVKFCSRDCNMSSSQHQLCGVQSLQSLSVPIWCHSLSLRLPHEMRAQSRPGWSKAAMCFLIPAWCYLRRKTEPQAFPGASDPHLQTLTVSLWLCEDKCVLLKNSALFEAGFLALKRLLLSSFFPHTWNSNHLQLKGFIWHKIQYGCGNTKLQRQRKEKEPWFYLMYN